MGEIAIVRFDRRGRANALSFADKDQQVAVWLSEEFAQARRRFAGKG